MLDGVLQQGLQQHRRQQRAKCRMPRGRFKLRPGVVGPQHPQLVAKATPLDGHKVPAQRQLLGQWHAFALGQGQTEAKELRQIDRHLTRLTGVERGQSADRVQAVEQKVRVNLRTQQPQLGFARQQARVGLARRGLARGLDRHQHIVRQQRQQIEAATGRIKPGPGLAAHRHQRRPTVGQLPEAIPQPCQAQPDATRKQGRRAEHADRRPPAPLRQWLAATQVVGRQRNEGIDQAQGCGEQQGRAKTRRQLLRR